MATLVRRSCYATVGPFDERLSYEDWDMWLRLADAYEFRFSTAVSASYRSVATSLVQTHASPRNASYLLSNFRIVWKWLGRLAAHDRPRYALAVTRLMQYADGLYRLRHPERRETVRAARLHAGALGPLSRVRLHLLWACSELRLPYGAYRAFDGLVAALRRRMPPARQPAGGSTPSG
jgi:hypothetical protein